MVVTESDGSREQLVFGRLRGDGGAPAKFRVEIP